MDLQLGLKEMAACRFLLQKTAIPYHVSKQLTLVTVTTNPFSSSASFNNLFFKKVGPSNFLRFGLKCSNDVRLYANATTTATSTTVGDKGKAQEPQKARIRDELDLSFSDARQAYRSKSTWEILRAWVVFKLCSINYLVENNDKVSHSHPDTVLPSNDNITNFWFRPISVNENWSEGAW